MLRRIAYLLLLVPFLLWTCCTRPSDEILAEAGMLDSLATEPVAEDSDITYAPVSTSSLTDASTLLDASRLMTEDSTALLQTDTLDEASVDTLHPRSLGQRILRWLTTPRDSLLRVTPELFAVGDAFEVIDDSLLLRQLPLTDELPLRRGFDVVVVERMTETTDSTHIVWIKLAHDQYVMGWVPEDELPGRLLPDDSVSQFIYFFSHRHGALFLVVIGLFGLGIVWRTVRLCDLPLQWFRYVDSAYSVLFVWLLASTAFLYALIQHYFPEVWQQFYYHPSLNPLHLAPLLSVFMLMVWGTVWVGMALADELFHQSLAETAFFYGFGMLSYGILLYVLFTFLPSWLGLPAWVAYTAFSFLRLRYHLRFRYTCGQCGAKMSATGRCPVCGAINE